ncbi:hypothetical protein F5B21DRAFT_465782 [Xylaria acuta]|nr:hypothetical protein F5B21DRAFT_465782 [Xylaria acuta]
MLFQVFLRSLLVNCVLLSESKYCYEMINRLLLESFVINAMVVQLGDCWILMCLLYYLRYLTVTYDLTPQSLS